MEYLDTKTDGCHTKLKKQLPSDSSLQPLITHISLCIPMIYNNNTKRTYYSVYMYLYTNVLS